MTESVDSYVLSGNLYVTYRAVYNVIVRAVVYTVCGNVILFNGLTCGVTESVCLVCYVGIVTYGTGVGCVSAVYTIGSSYYRFIIVTKSIYGYGFS